MDMKQQTQLMASELQEDASEFVNTVIQNPDSTIRGGCPDMVDGYTFVRNQTISTQIDTSGVSVPTPTVDVYIVDWDHESVLPILAKYYLCNYVTGAPNVFDDSATFQLETGGCIAYVMAAGTSPFPSTNPSVLGPVAPLKIVPLRFDGSILSGNLRVLGKNFEVKYTAPEVLAQGLITQSTYSSYESDEQVFLTTGGLTTNPVHSLFAVKEKSLPPGDISNMVKYPGSVQRPAFDGVLQTAVIDYSDNRPSYPSHYGRLYRSPNINTVGANYGLMIAQATNSSGILVTPIPAPYWRSNSEIHYAVFTGLIPSFSLQLYRSITVETFPNPADTLIAFAHRAPISNVKLLEVVMNGVRSTPQFWAAGDNANGDMSRTLLESIGTLITISEIVSPGSGMAFTAMGAAAGALSKSGAITTFLDNAARGILGGVMPKQQSNRSRRKNRAEPVQQAKAQRPRTQSAQNVRKVKKTQKAVPINGAQATRASKNTVRRGVSGPRV